MKYFLGTVCLLNTSQQNFILRIFYPAFYICAELLNLSITKKSLEHGLPIARNKDFITWYFKYFRRGLQYISIFVGVFRENFALLRMENSRFPWRYLILSTVQGRIVSQLTELVFLCTLRFITVSHGSQLDDILIALNSVQFLQSGPVTLTQNRSCLLISLFTERRVVNCVS